MASPPNYTSQLSLIQNIAVKDQTLFQFLGQLDSNAVAISNFLAAQIFERTLIIFNSTVGNNIANTPSVQSDGICIGVQAVLQATISVNLKVRINYNNAPLIVCDVPTTQVKGIPVVFKGFTGGSTSQNIKSGSSFSADILTSDGSIATTGAIATFTLLWS